MANWYKWLNLVQFQQVTELDEKLARLEARKREYLAERRPIMRAAIKRMRRAAGKN